MLPSEMRLPERYAPAARNISIYILCGQISASVHFALWISILVYLPDQSSPAPTLRAKRSQRGSRQKHSLSGLLDNMHNVRFTTTIFAQWKWLSRCRGAASSTFTTASEATITAFTALPARSSRRGPIHVDFAFLVLLVAAPATPARR
ncbi:hypothetical protein GGX14DRAFT_402542 [Mycena pura]|uniref:Uncharacterized protein n=1 Tax=Mycena pura TaxID=153505 RepID=A0AAD6V5B9_9AGAR|nr:hypothetical protein GGX14DRAFT_402542 [Mycena pura]